MPLPVTALVLDRAPAEDAGHPDYKLLHALPDGRVLGTVPRYEAFTRYSRCLAVQDIGFTEIADNSGEIVLSLLVPAQWTPTKPGARSLFRQPILTRPGPCGWCCRRRSITWPR